MNKLLNFLISFFILISIDTPNVFCNFSEKNLMQDADQIKNDTIELELKNGKGRISAYKEESKPIYIRFYINNGEQLKGKVLSDDPDANIRFTQIFMPDGEADGPWGREIEYELRQTGEYVLIVGENMMAGDPWDGNVVVELQVSDKNTENELLYTIAENYFVHNTIPNRKYVEKITTQQRFNEIYGQASTMTSKPTPIDFEKQDVLSLILPLTDISIELSVSRLFYDKGRIILEYERITGGKQSYVIRPFLLLVIEKNNQEQFKAVQLVSILNGEGTVTPFEDRFIPQDYSGITWIGGDQYAVVSDKKDGFFKFKFDINEEGLIYNLNNEGFFGDSTITRDCEGIVYYPEKGTVFISGEADQEILEYDLNGNKTGTRLEIPDIFKQIRRNYGFESLDYDKLSGLFWTMTESTLDIDGEIATLTNNIQNLLRLQSFDGITFLPKKQYAYKMDFPEGNTETIRYAFGVPDIAALPDGRLLIMEREFYVSRDIITSWVNNKLFIVDIEEGEDISDISDLKQLDVGKFLHKTLLWERKTDMGFLTEYPMVNFEGMCLGPMLDDGSQTLILINDVQGGVIPLMKEYILVLKLQL